MGACVVRKAAGDDRPVCLFRCDQGGASETVYSPHVHVRVHRAGLMVLSGTGVNERPYSWSRDVLTVKANELPAFELHDGKRLERLLEALPTDYAKATTKRRKTA